MATVKNASLNSNLSTNGTVDVPSNAVDIKSKIIGGLTTFQGLRSVMGDDIILKMAQAYLDNVVVENANCKREHSIVKGASMVLGMLPDSLTSHLSIIDYVVGGLLDVEIIDESLIDDFISLKNAGALPEFINNLTHGQKA